MEKISQWEKDLGITVNRFDNHHEYHLQLSRKMGIGWRESDNSFMGKTKEQWKTLYDMDEHLNNHPLSHFDALYPYHHPTAGRKGIPWSMSTTVCCLKAVIKEKVKDINT